MPDPNLDEYYTRRAAQSRDLANAATSVEDRRVHEEMVAVYERLAGTESSVRPTLKLGF